MKATIDIANMDVFKDTFKILQDILSDERIDTEIRIEYAERATKAVRIHKEQLDG